MLRKVISLLRYQGPHWLLFRSLDAWKRRTGWFRRRFPCKSWTEEVAVQIRADLPLLPPPSDRHNLGTEEAVRRAERLLEGTFTWFSYHEFAAGFPPDWFFNPWSPGESVPKRKHWSGIHMFAHGDIKRVWEQSRFEMVFPLVRAYARSGSPKYVEAFWRAIEDWRDKNLPQCGPHWMCGQEVALRAIAWTFGFLAFRGEPTSTARREAILAEMLEISAHRITANIDYALSQKNNHSVSEATGLFTIGGLLDRPRWVRQGQLLLERLARELIYDDGSFAMHSTNYHRHIVHDFLWAIRFGEAAGCPVSGIVIDRVRRAGLWLRALLSTETGRVPNLGSNDGVHLLDLTDLDYLDYRPTVQAVGLITEKRRWLAPGPWDELAAWLGATVDYPVDAGEGASALQLFPDGGYAVWRRGPLVALLRCPRRFRHRPSQCDLLHFDLWHRGRNLLRDAGTYSYNCGKPWSEYFSSSAAHNTIRFDDRDPMPKLGRFLYGEWPRGEVQQDIGDTVSAAYCDYRGVRHRRTVRSTAEGFRIEDRIGGPFREAVLRWRLDPDVTWSLTGDGCSSPIAELCIRARTESELLGPSPSCARQILQCENAPSGQSTNAPLIRDGWESLYYWQKASLPVLEIRVDTDCRELTTDIRIRS